MALNTINWQTVSFLGAMDNRWVITGGGYIDEASNLNLPAGAKAELTLTTEVAKEFKYIKMVSRYYSESLTDANNFNSALSSIRLQEVYRDGQGAIFRMINRTVGLNTVNFNNTTQYYTDENIFTTLDKKMAYFKVTVDNTKNNKTLVINSLSMFTSIDVSESQVSQATQNTLNKQKASTFKVYRNEDTSVKGLGVFIDGSANEIKFKPNYLNRMLYGVSTNFGNAVAVINTFDDIDLETST